jgi:hypothetical protein
MRVRMPVIVVAALVSTLLSGCVTPRQNLEVKKQAVQAIDRIPKAIYGSTRAVIADDATKIDPYETASDQGAAHALAEIDAIQKQVAEQEKMLKEFLTAAVNAAGSAVPGGGLAVAAVNSFLFKIKSSGDEAKSAGAAAAIEKAAAVETKTNEKLASAQTEIQGLKAELAKKDVEFTARIERESRALKDFVAQLTDAQKKQFKEEFLLAAAQQGVSKEELERLKGLSPDALLALLGSGGTLGSISVVSLLRTLGKSRSQPEIETSRMEIERSKTEIERSQKQIDELYDKFVELKSKAADTQVSSEKSKDGSSVTTTTKTTIGA